jgi:hypothetical protein
MNMQKFHKCNRLLGNGNRLITALKRGVMSRLKEDAYEKEQPV